MGTRPGSVFWHLVAGRAGPTGRQSRLIRVPYDISRRWKGCSTRSERAWVSETPNPASLRLVERPAFRARAPIRSTRIESKATKQASKGAGVRAFYWLGRGIIVSRQEVPGKVTCDPGGEKWINALGTQAHIPARSYADPVLTKCEGGSKGPGL